MITDKAVRKRLAMEKVLTLSVMSLIGILKSVYSLMSKYHIKLTFCII
jgi:hypothetical protein